MTRSEETGLSVFEFIYVDWKRVANLLSQLDPNGMQTSLETMTSRDKSTSIKIDGGGEVGIPLVKKGSLNAEIGGELGNAASTIRQFDVRDVAPQTLLSLLEDRGLIGRKPKDAALGSIALMSGRLHLMDLGVVGDGWDSVVDGGDKGIAAIAASAFAEPIGFLFGDRKKPWIPLRRDGWEIGFSGMLTHGHCVEGTWNFLGLISKKPQEKAPSAPHNMFPDSHIIPQILASMEDTRSQIGCPLDFYAMTPLLGFREVASP